MSKILFDDLWKEVDRRIKTTLNNWRPDLTHSTGALPSNQVPQATNTNRGGVTLSNSTPADVGTSASGAATAASRSDHVHALGSTTDSNARVGVRKNSAGSTFLRRRVNLIEGSNVTLTVADDSGNEEVDITIDATAGASTLTVEEVDGSPTDSAVTKIVFPNGTLAIASHEATYTPASVAAPDYIHIVDSQTTGTDGGTFTNGAWRTRVLNTEKSDTGGDASLSANQITLAAGTWRVQASAPAYACNRHQARLYDMTNTAVLLNGTSEHNAGGSFIQNRSHVLGRFTITGSTVIELQHQCETTSATYGLGVASGAAFTVTEEIYAVVELFKE